MMPDDDDLAIDMDSTVSLSLNLRMREADQGSRVASAASSRRTSRPRIFLSGRHMLFANPRPAQSSVLPLSKAINSAPVFDLEVQEHTIMVGHSAIWYPQRMGIYSVSY